MTIRTSATIKTAGLIAYGLSFTGLFLIMLSVLGSEVWHWPVWIHGFIRDLGLLLAAVMAGTILHEKLLRDEALAAVVDEFDSKLEARIPKLTEIAHGTATEVHTLFVERPPAMKGIRFLHDRRRNYSGYYSWVNDQNPQDLFFAGRSVLHRIDAGDDDFSNRIKAMKIRFVQTLPPTEGRSSIRIAKGDRRIRQRRFWEHAIRDEGDYARHLDYVHFNPVQHGYV